MERKFQNATHHSTTDPDARLYRKSKGKEAQFSYNGLDRARYRGLHKLDRQLILTASVQNLKRLVSYVNRKKEKPWLSQPGNYPVQYLCFLMFFHIL